MHVRVKQNGVVSLNRNSVRVYGGKIKSINTKYEKDMEEFDTNLEKLKKSLKDLKINKNSYISF